MEEIVGAAPRVPHLRGVRPGVGELVHRVLLRRIEVGRLDENRLHRKAVARPHLQHLRPREAEIGEGRRGVAIDNPDLRAVRAVNTDLRGRGEIAPRTDVHRERGAERRVVRAGRLRQPRQSGPIEVHAIHVTADRAPFRAGKVDPVRGLIHPVKRPYLPRSRGDRLHDGAVRRAVIQVSEARPFALPDERSILQPDWLTVVVHPRARGLAEQRRETARRGIREIEIEPRLLAVLHLDDRP